MRIEGDPVSTNNGVFYFVADHLGSTSLTLDANGAKIGEMKYYPFGETRYVNGTLGTDRHFTGQREESGLGSLYDYNARMYSPALGRFLSADSIVPGAASGSGGGAATLGVDSGSRLTTLTTDFHEFIGQVTQENQAVLQYGPFFQWSGKVRQNNPVPSGPLNPQALNRYSYVLNNPLRYVDPTGHDSWITMLWQMIQSPVGADVFGHIPMDTTFKTWWAISRAAQPQGHQIWFPNGFDPMDPSNVGTLGHELVHIRQRDAVRPGMTAYNSTMYGELEAAIIGYSIEYDLKQAAGGDTASLKQTLRTLTGSLNDAYQWLRDHGENWADIPVGNGNWRDTLRALGYSAATIKYIEDIIK